MAKLYKISLLIDARQAEASAARAAKMQQQVERAATRSAQQVEKAAERQAKAQEKAADRAARAAEKAADRQQQAAERAAANLQRIEDRYVKADIDRRTAAEARKQRQAERTAERQAQTAEKTAEREERSAARGAEKLQRIQDQYLLKDYRNRVAYEEKKAKLAESGSALGEVIDKYATMATAIGAAGFAAKEVIGYFDDQHRQVLQGTRDLVSYRTALLELQALKGQAGNTTKGLQEELVFRAKTLQSRESSESFQRAALGTGQSGMDAGGVQKLISQAEMKKAMELGGAFQAMEHGNAETHGQLVGMLPQLMGGRRVTGREVFQKEQQLYNILQPGGADFTPAMSQLMKTAPLTKSGVFRDIADQAALLSAFSTTNREGAGEQVEQFSRATVGGLGRMKGVKVEGESEKIGQYLKRVGATNQMDPIQIGTLISQDFEAQEKAEGAKGRTFNALEFLNHHGYGNMEDKMSLMAFHGLRKTGQWQNTFAPLAATMPSGEDAEKNIKSFQATDPAALEMKNEVGKDLATTAVSGGKPEVYHAVRKSAFDRLKARKELSTPQSYEEWENRPWWERTFDLKDQGASVQTEVDRSLNAQRKTLGLAPKSHFAFTESGKMDAVYDSAVEVAGKGGSPTGDLKELVRLTQKGIDESIKLREAFEKSQKPPDAPPMRRAPQPPQN